MIYLKTYFISFSFFCVCDLAEQGDTRGLGRSFPSGPEDPGEGWTPVSSKEVPTSLVDPRHPTRWEGSKYP